MYFFFEIQIQIGKLVSLAQMLPKAFRKRFSDEDVSDSVSKHVQLGQTREVTVFIYLSSCLKLENCTVSLLKYISKYGPQVGYVILMKSLLMSGYLEYLGVFSV